jgi:unsaturated rhamnogalacturonyl hydrolase
MATAISQTPPVIYTWSSRMADSTLTRCARQEAQWHYEQGLLVKAIGQLGEASGDPRYSRFVRTWVDRLVDADGNIHTYQMEEFNLDQVNPGKVVFSLYRSTRLPRYQRALALLYQQLVHQPRTPSGGFWHKRIYPHQMWLDGLYMAAPFYAEYARVFEEAAAVPAGAQAGTSAGTSAAAFDDIVHQFTLVEEHTRDPQTGLLYHAWDESRQSRWANPVTGCSPHFWARAMGWYVMAIVDVLDYLPPTCPHGPRLVALLERAARALVRVQDSASGLWYQVLDLPDHPGNYREASASAMFVYAFAKAVRKGYLPSEYLSAARRAYCGLLENLIRVDSLGLLTLLGTCGSAGLGGDPYRDGSFQYYVSEGIVPNDPKGVGSFILAALEMETAGITMHLGD